MMLAIGGFLFLALANAATSEGDFIFPTLKSQPVEIDHVVRKPNDYVLVVLNRSLKTIKALEFTFAGTACIPPYKPVWPVELRDGLVVPPSAHVSVEIPRSVIDGVAARSLKSCGHAVATEISVHHVRFADGSNWDLGERVRAGEPYDEG
jgi:hypothetical protein